MASTNVWQRFKGLLPTGHRAVVTIIANNGNGTSQVRLRNGDVVVVEGELATAGSRVVVVDGKEVSTAPELAQYESTV